MDVILRPDLRSVLEHRLRSGQLDFELGSVNGQIEGQGSQGGVVGLMDTGEAVFIKRSDRTVQNAPLGSVGRTWVHNEAAGYEVARILGYEDIVLPTVLREGVEGGVEGGVTVELAIRLFVEASDDGDLDEGAPLPQIDPDQLARAAIFDWVVEQTDRRKNGDQHGGNWYVLREPGCEPRLLLFDHQLCFGSRDGVGLNSAIWETAGHRVGPHVGDLNALLTDDARARLRPYLSDEQIDHLVERARQLLRAHQPSQES